eukprot:12996874-Ditylum_brightwellii.AAC.1
MHEAPAIPPTHAVGGVGDGGVAEGVGAEVVGVLLKQTRSAGLPPVHTPEQQSTPSLHDSSTWAKVQVAVGELVGFSVGGLVGFGVGGLVGNGVVGFGVGGGGVGLGVGGGVV